MFLAEFFAISAAACTALSAILIGELKGRVPLLVLTRWQMFAGFAITAAASAVTGGWRAVEPWQAGALALSGLFGIIIASSAYFAAIYIAGARTTSLLYSLTAPFAVLFGYLGLGETITAQQGIGIGLVVAGVILAIGGPREVGAPSGSARIGRVAALGIVLGLITAIGQAIGTLAARPAMAAGAEPFTAMAIRSGVAALFYLALSLLPIAAAKGTARFSPRIRLTAFGAAFVGTGVGMSLFMAALAHGNVGIVATLSSLTPVLILPMVWMRTRKRPDASAWAGAALAVAGIGLISL
ncbi:DMT family transporter [Mycoplana dimorpha]|uniref:Putative membrane protein n=1 Tax=Mycoplana dimorpha TaxID=28320 RepID=A0A2T5B3E5_MYCDI|nr:DMT family transporter [Mycoplana dimorpha]PTM93503.1 putative membrane protein [Mycoplana dimorpha]